MTLSTALYIFGTQHIGGLLGAAVSKYWLGAARFADNIPVPTIPNNRAFVAEMMYAALLVLVYLHTTTTHASRGNQYYGMAIGFAQLAGRMVLARPTGGAFNPAIVTGLYALNNTNKDLWMYYFGPFFGSAIACLFFVIMAPDEYFKDEVVWGKKTPYLLKLILVDWGCAKYFTEFIGTWILTQTAILGNAGACGAVACAVFVLSACLARGPDCVPRAGFTLMAIVYMGGYVSVGQYNPALAIGCWVRGVMPGFECFLYCVSQFLGGVVGGGVARFVVGVFLECGYNTPGKVCAPLLACLCCVVACRLGLSHPPLLLLLLQAWLAEWMWTLLLVLVVLSTASSKREPNMYFGLSIGAIVLTGDAFFGEWSNGMFNPAVGLGTCAIDIFEGHNADGLWIYIVRGLLALLACIMRGALS